MSGNIKLAYWDEKSTPAVLMYLKSWVRYDPEFTSAESFACQMNAVRANNYHKMLLKRGYRAFQK